MIPSTLKKLAGTKVAIIAAGVIVLAGAGVAGAAAADIGPWLSDAPEVTSPPVTSAVAETSATAEPTTTAAPVTTEATVPPTEATEPTLPPATEPPATEPQATEPPATTPNTVRPVSTEPPATTPHVEPPATEPPAPVTTEKKPDTSVPQGIELACDVVEQVSVQCEWHGGVVDGFSRYLVLRSDGRVVFGTENPDIHTYLDQPGKAGAFSYVVISVDGNNKNLSHSNPVSVEVGSPA